MSNDRIVMQALDGALAAMNHAIELTRDHGPHFGMESIADYLNAHDAADEDVIQATPNDWLTQWQVTR